MDISIIIPTLNRPIAIRRCLDSIKSQSFKGTTEIIVIDQNRFSLKLPENIIHLIETEHNVSKARNIGLEKATGEYIVFLGDDIVIDRFFLEAHYDVIKQYDTNIAFIGRTVLDRNIATQYNEILNLLGWGDTSISNKEDCGFYSFNTSNFIISRDMIGSQRFITQLAYPAFEDNELGYRLYQQGLIIKHNQDAIAYHQHYYSWEDIMRRSYNMGYALALFLRLHPELNYHYHMGLKKKVLAKMLSMMWFNDFYKSLGNIVLNKIKGFNDYNKKDTNCF
jgi:glycosyltransferase involved in cell wall biosynthesis